MKLASWKEAYSDVYLVWDLPLPGNVQNIALANSEAICLWPSVTEPFSPLLRRGTGCVTRAGKCRHIWTACGNILENDSSNSVFSSSFERPANRLLHLPPSLEYQVLTQSQFTKSV